MTLNIIAAPLSDGSGAAKCMQLVPFYQLQSGRLRHINAHGTSTQANDFMETAAIKTAFGEHAKKMLICSTKSRPAICWATSAVWRLQSLRPRFIIKSSHRPLTTSTSIELASRFSPNQASNADIKVGISNSFGSTKACITLRKYE